MKDWKDITLKQYYKIVELLEEPDEYTTFNLLDLIYGIDSANMPLTDFNKYKDALVFLNTQPKTVNLKNQYNINDTVYNSNYNLTLVTAGQFIDYQNYVGSNKYEDFLSVFFIPEGHKYNDGYDMNKVKEDLLDLPITIVKSICFFFTLQYAKFSKHFLSYLHKDLKKMNLPKEKMMVIEDKIKVLKQANLELFQ